MDVELPEPFDEQYTRIVQKFIEMKDTYGYYDDGRLPQDNAYVVEIMTFLTGIFDYMEINFEKIDLEQWALFLTEIPAEFNYGDEGLEHNYLELEGIDLVALLLKFDERPTILQISSIRKKLEKALPKFS